MHIEKNLLQKLYAVFSLLNIIALLFNLVACGEKEHLKPDEGNQVSYEVKLAWDDTVEDCSLSGFHRISRRIVIGESVNSKRVKNVDSGCVDTTLMFKKEKIWVNESSSLIQEHDFFGYASWDDIVDRLRSKSPQTKIGVQDYVGRSSVGITQDDKQVTILTYRRKSGSYNGLIIEKDTGVFFMFHGYRENQLMSWGDWGRLINVNIKCKSEST